MSADHFIFPISLELRIDWSELDLFGHVNNVMYFKYLQASRIQCRQAMGIDQWLQEKGIGPMLASARCDFRKPLLFPGSITIGSSIEFIRNTSFGLFHRIWNERKELAAE